MYCLKQEKKSFFNNNHQNNNYSGYTFDRSPLVVSQWLRGALMTVKEVTLERSKGIKLQAINRGYMVTEDTFLKVEIFVWDFLEF